ncbi:tripartite tricarboxylate transporter TctB family protein [Haloplanus aerogenes]|nr:tripartite tricarboxylate transporter TctB family protein [Haloplanus aerogenes]RMB25027.1 tripartite tricarboxylate transporter TctB family protein [Haloplanus aerogenes]
MVQEKFENLTSEHALLVFLVVVSGFMVARSFQWSRTTAIFPQFVGSATLIGALLLLARDYLPEPLHTVVTGSTSITGGGQSDEMRAEKEAEAGEHRESNVPDRPVPPALFTGILVTLYIGLSFLFSMFIVTPLFVVAYLVWFERPWYMIVFLTALSIVLAYAFAQILIVPVDRGVFVGDLLYISLPGVP